MRVKQLKNWKVIAKRRKTMIETVKNIQKAWKMKWRKDDDSDEECDNKIAEEKLNFIFDLNKKSYAKMISNTAFFLSSRPSVHSMRRRRFVSPSRAKC